MRHTYRVLTAAIVASLCLVPLAGCAPEPGTIEPGTGNPGKPGIEAPGTIEPDGKPSLTDKQEPDGESWPEKAPPEAFEKHVEVPADFPAAFVIPEGATIDDVGARGAGVWFLVLRATDAAAGEALWNAVIEAGQFAVAEGEAPAEGGKSGTLQAATVTVEATMFPDAENGMLLSYDITQAVG